MTINKWLTANQATLKQVDIVTARLDCLVLLEDETGKDRGWLLAHPEYELQGSVLKKLSTKITRRSQHIPLAYIRGHAEFYGREFAVNAHTLVPRPETETMIDLLKQLVGTELRRGPSSTSAVTIADIGTGSGAIAVTAKLELPQAEVIATDIDEQCLETARANAQTLSADISFLQGNLLGPFRTMRLSDYPTILLCNLPYVPDNFQINTAATHEPKHALFGGPDGLDLYRELFQQLSTRVPLGIPKGALVRPAYILAESLPLQHETLAAIAKSAGYSLQKTDDFIQVFTNP